MRGFGNEKVELVIFIALSEHKGGTIIVTNDVFVFSFYLIASYTFETKSCQTFLIILLTRKKKNFLHPDVERRRGEKVSVNAETEIYVLKIGGSVLTEKGAEKSARASEIERISEEIAAAMREWRESSMRRMLILVHGAGSFGHPQAMKFLKSGEARDAILTHLAVCELNAMFVASLLRKGVSAIPLHPFCIFSASEDFKALNEQVARILNANTAKGERASDILVPVLHGDVIFNGDSFQILSGDRIVVHLAAYFNAKRSASAQTKTVFLTAKVV